jgi:hypothetical protein
MLEVAMLFSLAIMGIYFFKSTDLPKDLVERSTQLRAETGITNVKRTIKMSYPVTSTVESNVTLDNKLSTMKIQKKAKEITLLSEEIDKLTIEITTLEQEIKVNNQRNAEIQLKIESKLSILQDLQEKLSTLS